MHGLASLGIAPHPGLAVFHLKRPESNQLNFPLRANAIGDRTQDSGDGIFGSALGGTYDEILAYYARPFPAIVAALTLIVGFKHFNDGVQVLIEDYVHGLANKVALIVMTIISYGAAAVGVFAIAKLAL